MDLLLVCRWVYYLLPRSIRDAEYHVNRSDFNDDRLFGCEYSRCQTTDLDYVLRVIPLGLGWGIFQSPNNGAIPKRQRKQSRRNAWGLLSLTRTLRQTTGLPLFTAIFAAIAPTGNKCH